MQRGCMQKPAQNYGALDLLESSFQPAKLHRLLWVHIVLCFVYVLFGAGVIIVKLTLHTSNPVFFELLRELASTPLLYILALATGSAGLPQLRDVPQLLAAGVCLFGNQMLSIVGLKLTSPVVATVWQTSIPIWTISLAVLTRSETLSVQKALGILIAVGGAIFIVLADAQYTGFSEAHISHKKWGHFMFFTKCLSNAGYLVCTQHLSVKYKAVPVTAWCFTISSILSLCLWLLVSTRSDLLTFTCWSSWKPALDDCADGAWRIRAEMLMPLAYEVLCCTLVAWLLLVWASQHVKASEVATYVVIQPATTCSVSAVLVLMKGPGWATMHGIWLPGARNVLGVAMIVAGLLLVMLRQVEHKSTKGGASVPHPPEESVTP